MNPALTLINTQSDRPDRDSLTVWVCLSIAGLAAIATIISWYSGQPDFTSAGSNDFPMSVHTSILVLLFVITSALLNHGRLLPARAVAAALMTLFLVHLAYQNNLLSADLTRAFREIVPTYGFTRQLVSINGLIALLLLASSALLLTSPKISRETVAVALIMAITSMYITGLAIFGYIIGSESAYWWVGELPISPLTAWVLLILCISQAKIAWRRINSTEHGLGQILEGIHIVPPAMMIVAVVLGVSFVSIPLYESTLVFATKDMERLATETAERLSDYLKDLSAVAATLPLSSQGELIPGSVVRDDSGLIIKNPSANPRKLAGAADIMLVDSQPNQRVGVPVIWSPAGPADPRSGLLFVDVPLREMPRMRRRSLRVSLSNSFVENLLPQQLRSVLLRGQLYLVPDEPGIEEKVGLSFSSSSLSKIEAPQIPANLSPSYIYSHAEAPFVNQRYRRSEFSTFDVRLKGAPYKLMLVYMPGALRTLAPNLIFNIALGIAVIVLTASGMTYLLMRKLTDQVRVLEKNLHRSLSKAEEEIALRANAQLLIEKSLREKEILLKEIHHRVKNNLQVITSILNLQMRRTKNPEVVESLRESSNRILSISLLHDTLYRTDDFTNLPLSAYFAELVHYLSRSYESTERVTTKIETNDITMEIDRAIPLGLIVTELFTNSLKYAFPLNRIEKHSPQVLITTVLGTQGETIFTYHDNGVGLPPDFSLDDSSSLGSRLISALSSQLGEQISVSAKDGMTFEIVIPKAFEKEERKYEQAANSNS